MPLHPKSMRMGQGIVLFLIFAFWVIMLAGLGRVQDMCNSGGFNPQNQKEFGDLDPELQAARSYVRDGHLIPLSWSRARTNGYPGRDWTEVPGANGTGEGRDDKCGILFSWDWWTVMFQAFLILYSMLSIMSESFHSLKHTLIAFYVIAIFQSTVFTSIFTKYTYAFNGGNHSEDAVGQGSAVAVVGGIGLTIFNYVFIFLFGSSEVGFSNPEDANPEVKIDK
ncbi:hypothetical protein DUNSADRAFT_8815 [Dunaliella salina]|uniref:Uncharacterized protein n=1 Tax=Dunaliella salina TaxID=3046 RepID=A0ABQ7GIQ3_DUNSA|nr:hypothetical protein DUNSADRAFT_8815 [Dunaliella salina]|eukprot:KAF5834490.1 hypothetical protein DUNSADRAFT_8815 [Dunaliella salina]